MKILVIFIFHHHVLAQAVAGAVGAAGVAAGAGGTIDITIAGTLGGDRQLLPNTPKEPNSCFWKEWTNWSLCEKRGPPLQCTPGLRFEKKDILLINLLT